mgnify:CR=1 FL=1
MNDRYLVMWCSEGLEFLFNITAYEKIKAWNILKGVVTDRQPPSIKHLILRARMNSQRHYEIYVFNGGDVPEEEIRSLFDTDPQVIVNAIRKNGEQIFSDRASKAPKIL